MEPHEDSNSWKWGHHHLKENQTEVFCCQMCPFATKTEKLLFKHVQTQHNPHRKVYTCELCSYRCLQERTFHLHQLKHSDSEAEAKFACDQCGKLFLSMGIMKRHTLTHSKIKPFICNREGCGKSFNIKSRLTDHVRSVHKSKENSIKSQNESNIKPNVQLDLRDEMKTEAKISSMAAKDRIIGLTNDDRLVEYSAPSTALQTSHLGAGSVELKNNFDENVVVVYDFIVPTTDTNNLPDIESSKCSNLKNVVISREEKTSKPTQTQRPEKKKRCSATHKAINQKNKVEQNNSKYMCSWSGCGKSFRDGYNLRMHVYTHTGEMQRACKLCGYSCVQKSALDKHMKVHQTQRGMK